MAQFAANAQRLDPYKNFKFRVAWDGKYVAGVSKVSPLKRTTEVVKHREGGDASSSRKSPGRTEYEAITLERGVTHDTEFEKWANKVWDYANAQAAPDQRQKESSLTCPSCNHGWHALFDIVSFFWSEIQSWASRIMREVHLLASAYGWRETDILAMSPLRRRLYLEMVGV